MTLAAQDRDSRVREDGANPLGSFARPIASFLAEQEQHRGGKIAEAPGIGPVRLFGSYLASHGMRGCESRYARLRLARTR